MHDAIQLDAVDAAIIEILKAQADAQPGYTSLSAVQLLEELRKRGQSISQPTLSRRLDRLRRDKHVAIEGAGRATRYRRDTYHDEFALPPERRPPRAYDFSLLASYEPNKTYWLSESDRKRMRERGENRAVDASTYSKAIAQKLLVELSYASSALEGNTYSYLDTKVLIEYGQAAAGKDPQETLMILNHKEAINYIITNIKDLTIEPREIRTLHALLARGLLPDPKDIGGIRTGPVNITGTAYTPMAIPQKLDEELAKICDKARQIEDPYEQSFFLMTMIPYLQAFRDVNKRTGRLACNIPLLKAKLAPFSFIEIDKTAYVTGLIAFYERGRTDILADAYVDSYIRSAARYDAYAARPAEEIRIEMRRASDLASAAKAYVAQAIELGERPKVRDFVGQYFANDVSDEKPLIIERAIRIIEALDEANHVAYGISRADFTKLQQISNPPAPNSSC
jgi:Fic family protein